MIPCVPTKDLHPSTPALHGSEFTVPPASGGWTAADPGPRRRCVTGRVDPKAPKESAGAAPVHATQPQDSKARRPQEATTPARGARGFRKKQGRKFIFILGKQLAKRRPVQTRSPQQQQPRRRTTTGLTAAARRARVKERAGAATVRTGPPVVEASSPARAAGRPCR